MNARAFSRALAVSLSVMAMAHAKDSGTYSRQAKSLWPEIVWTHNTVAVRSPDGRSSVTASFHETADGGEYVALRTSGRIGALTVRIGPGVGSELLWAPDSSGFFVTTSDGGANGLYRLIVVGRFNGKLQSRDVSGLIHKTFGHPVRCGSPEPPNVGGIAWIPPGNHILVAAEIVSHSNCDSFGTFKAYEVDPEAMKVVHTYGQLPAKKHFRAYLGSELANAPDECVLSPRSCWVSTNHHEQAAGERK